MLFKRNTQAQGYSWGYIRQKGLKRYVREEGVLYWGGGMTLLMLCLARISIGPLSIVSVLLILVECTVAGGIFGVTSWYILEKLYNGRQG